MVFKKKKKVEEPEEVEEEMIDEDYIDEDEEEPKNKTKETSGEWEVFLANMDERFGKIENAVAINQRYIKKLWEKVGKVEEDFKLFIDKS